MNANEDCLKSWFKNDWNFTNSLKTPMGPVFDQRWEGKSSQLEKKNDIYRMHYDVTNKIFFYNSFTLKKFSEFKEYKNLEDTYDYVDFELTALTTEVKLSFSVRVAHDAHILICNSKNYNRDFCYWIIIGGWGNTMSAIRKCVSGVPTPGTWPKDMNCKTSQVSFNVNICRLFILFKTIYDRFFTLCIEKIFLIHPE